MKKVGFIDYYLDEWHANNYPEKIKAISDGEFEVCYAYAKIDSPKGMTNKEWAEKYNVELLPTIEEVIEKSDCLIVLSPDNPEMHEELADLPLKSGKLTYVDKTFAPDKETAIKLFKIADEYGTKCYSSSALRFSDEYKDIDKSKIFKLFSEGPGLFFNYPIHQIEPIVMLMQSRAKRLMFLGDEVHPEMIIEFEDGRYAHMYQRSCADGFVMNTIDEQNNAIRYQVKSDFFDLFIKDLIRFFRTGEVTVAHEETIDIMGILEVSKKAANEPFVWFDI